MFVYKTLVNLYVKLVYNTSSILEVGNTSRSKEVALFMIIGAPAIAGTILTINYITSWYASGSDNKILISIGGNLDLEGSSSALASGGAPFLWDNLSSSGCVDTETGAPLISSSLFLFFNKLTSWLKILLKYIALYFIMLIIVSVIGYKSTIIVGIYSHLGVFQVYFFKLFCILNFLVVIYYI